MKELLRDLGYKSAKEIINRLLSTSKSNVYEIKSIIINGINKYLEFTIHFIKSSRKKHALIAFLRDNLGFSDYIPFPSTFSVIIKNNLFNEVTDQAVENQQGVTIINLNKLLALPGKVFVINVRGHYEGKIRDLVKPFPRNRPIFEDDNLRKNTFKLVFYRSSFVTEDLSLLDIPIKVFLSIGFLNKIIFDDKILLLKKYIEKFKDNRRKYKEYTERLEKSKGIPYDKFWNYVGRLILRLQVSIEKRFNEFLTLTSTSHCSISNVVLTHKRAYPDLPDLNLEATILVDYRKKEDKIIDLELTLDKEKLRKITDKLWSKITAPKRTAPTKTF